jgi:hypothetical protein
MKSFEVEINRFQEESLKLQADILQKEQILLEGNLERNKNRDLFRELNTRL